MADYSTNLVEAVEKAREQGAEVVLPPADALTLLLDLDTDAQRAQWIKMRPMLNDRFRIVKEEQWPSKSGNLHVMVTLDPDGVHPLSPGDLVNLATACGSDPARALLCTWQAMVGIEEPVMLFRPLTAPVTVVMDETDPVLLALEDAALFGDGDEDLPF
jgi:hypothetical protein